MFGNINVITQAFTKKFKYDFQQFMFSNAIMVSAAGFAIGTATKELIQKIMSDLVMPIVQYLQTSGVSQIIVKKLRLPPLAMGFLSVLGGIFLDVLMWLTIILFTFIILEYILNRRVIGMKTTVKTQDALNFIKSKNVPDESKTTQEELNELNKNEEQTKKAAKVLDKMIENKVSDVITANLQEENETFEKFLVAPNASYFAGFAQSNQGSK